MLACLQATEPCAGAILQSFVHYGVLPPHAVPSSIRGDVTGDTAGQYVNRIVNQYTPDLLVSMSVVCCSSCSITEAQSEYATSPAAWPEISLPHSSHHMLTAIDILAAGNQLAAGVTEQTAAAAKTAGAGA
jgi:hypothetical protein